LNPLDALSGTLVNTATVLVGGALGLLLRHRLPEGVRNGLIQAIGLITIVIGISNASDLVRVDAGVVYALLALSSGAALGALWRLGDRLEGFGDWLQQRLGSARVAGRGGFSEGFVTAALLFCVGPMTIVGSIQNGLSGDASLLLLKATLDGISAVALAASFGFGVMASALFVLIFQGGIALAASAVAGVLSDPASDPRVLLVNGVGGVLILGLGINLLELRRIAVANMLPALLVVVVLFEVGRRLG
jgi:uncharacterized membrane protein YqgA involved in biofilm formation